MESCVMAYSTHIFGHFMQNVEHMFVNLFHLHANILVVFN